MPKATHKIRQRRLKLAGHCHRHPEEAMSRLVQWEPDHGKRKKGRPALNLRPATDERHRSEHGRDVNRDGIQ